MVEFKKIKSKRVALVRVSREYILASLFKPTQKKVFCEWHYEGDFKNSHTTFPKNLKFVGMEYRAFLDSYEIVLESTDFKPLLEGEVLPKIVFCLESIYEKVFLK